MRRKAMLVGMAFMTGLPGWAMAKGTAKAVGEAHSYPVGSEALETLDRIESDQGQAVAGWSASSTPSRTASEVLAQVKAMLRGVNYGAVTPPRAEKWSMELLEGDARVYDNGDPRTLNAKPLGVAFRLKF